MVYCISSVPSCFVCLCTMVASLRSSSHPPVLSGLSTPNRPLRGYGYSSYPCRTLPPSHSTRLLPHFGCVYSIHSWQSCWFINVNEQWKVPHTMVMGVSNWIRFVNTGYHIDRLQRDNTFTSRAIGVCWQTSVYQEGTSDVESRPTPTHTVIHTSNETTRREMKATIQCRQFIYSYFSFLTKL